MAHASIDAHIRITNALQQAGLVLQHLTIATRESRLALWQAEHVQALLKSQGHDVQLLGMTTKGDQILDRSLSKVGGKGLFVKELELALEEGRANLAVHSLKDVPMELPEGFSLACVMEREDPRDAWVSSRYATLADLPHGAVVGTSSLRRVALLRALRPDLKIEPLRGNLDTRLKKLDDGQYDGIVLAAAGLKRLGLEARIRAVFEPHQMLPAAGQGALGIEIHAHAPEVAQALAPLMHQPTWLAVSAERAVSRVMGGSCSMPLAAFATLEGDLLRIEAVWGDPEGVQPLVRARAQGVVRQTQEAVALGEAVARQLQAGVQAQGPGTGSGVTGARRVIVTRPENEAHKWAQTLGKAGLQVDVLPMILVQGMDDPRPVVAAWQRLADFDAVMFVSGNAVSHFFESKPTAAPVFCAQAAIKTRAYVTGPGSLSAVLKCGAEREFVDAPAEEAAQFDSEALWAVMREQVVPGFRVLIVRGMSAQAPDASDGVGRDWFAKQVQAAGGTVEFVVTYQRRAPVLQALDAQRLHQAASDGSIWVFSSSEAVANLCALAEGQSWQSSRAVVTHPRIGRAVRDAGFGEVREARPTLASVLASIESMQS